MNLRLTKRKIGFLLLLGVVIFYTLGTGFTFFFRLLYVVGLLYALGLGWAWLNLRGIDVQLFRLGSRGQVGGNLEGRMQVFNRNPAAQVVAGGSGGLGPAGVRGRTGHRPGQGAESGLADGDVSRSARRFPGGAGGGNQPGPLRPLPVDAAFP